jgi:acetolactate synthase regulatory subunit
MPLIKDLREFVELLNSNKVDYLVVGAFAVAFHGYPRYTADLDILVRPTPDNAQRILHVLNQFGFASLGISASDLESYGMVVQLGVKPNRIDLLTAISGVSFEDAWDSRISGDLDGIATRFIGREALIRNKEHTGRTKDAGDAEELRKRATAEED